MDARFKAERRAKQLGGAVAIVAMAVEAFQNELCGFKVGRVSFHFGLRKSAWHWKLQFCL